jgi:hypothetical protein
MATKKRAPAARLSPLERALEQVTRRLEASTIVRQGTILVRTTDAEKGEFFLECSRTSVRLAKSSAAKTAAPTLEIIGKARQISAVISGAKDARRNFLAGGFRLRGDLRYASDLAQALGILKDPF